MRLRKALQFGLDCGLVTVGDAIHNIRVRCFELFCLKNIKKELQELEKDVETYWVHKDDLISDWIKKLNNKNV